MKDIQASGHKFVTILDPGLSTGEMSGSYPSFEAGQENDVWILGENGEPVTGSVWPEHPVYYVDFTKPEAKEWWKKEIVKFHGLLPHNSPGNNVYCCVIVVVIVIVVLLLAKMWRGTHNSPGNNVLLLLS